MPAKRPGQTVDIDKKAKAAIRDVRTEVYATRQFLGRDTQAKLDLRIPFDVYFQDPFVAASNPVYNFDEGFTVPWEPGISDGPTSCPYRKPKWLTIACESGDIRCYGRCL
jgi:hypothetical protein